MNLKEELLRGIYAYGFGKPSAIQQRAIVPCIKVAVNKVKKDRLFNCFQQKRKKLFPKDFHPTVYSLQSLLFIPLC